MSSELHGRLCEPLLDERVHRYVLDLDEHALGDAGLHTPDVDDGLIRSAFRILDMSDSGDGRTDGALPPSRSVQLFGTHVL